DPFVMPNPWDLGSAKVLAALGAKALATTSSGFAFTRGFPDGAHITRDQHLDHAREIVEATGLPVNGDFENGYGRDPETVAETVRLAAEAGLAGVGIEDIDLPGDAAYPFDLAVARIEAAVEAARAADIVLTARADGWLTRAYDGDEAVRRAQAFADTGADVIYAPLVKDDTIKALCKIGAPVNVLSAGPALAHDVAGLAAMGVARVSIGGALARATHKVLLDAGRALLSGDLAPLKAMANGAEIDAMLS
ncbi:MAG: isocitrate lyase/phosphoenolpyruvate mutase family protein, partial [Pseudomonadota bacterium]